MSEKIIIPVSVFDSAMQELSDTFFHCGYIARRELGDPEPVQVIDADHLAHQREWSLATFGPGSRLYRCPHCDWFHLGHRKQHTRDLTRGGAA